MIIPVTPFPEQSLDYPVYSKKDGVIGRIGWDETFGRIVTLTFRARRFGFTRTFTAIHPYMDGITVRPGAPVRKGTVLGYRRHPAQPITVMNKRGRVVKTLIYKGKVR